MTQHRRVRGSESRCCFFTPLHYESRYDYPVVIWLHGPRADERQLHWVMPLLSMRNYIAVAPRGNLRLQQDVGYDWSPVDSQLGRVDDLVLDALQAVKRKFHFDSRRVFLAGFQSGGNTAIEVAMRYPDRFAGAVSVGGGAAGPRLPLARLQEVRGLPILVARPHAPQDQSRCDLRLWHAAGLDVTLREFSAAGGLHNDVFRSVNAWIMGLAAGALIV